MDKIAKSSLFKSDSYLTNFDSKSTHRIRTVHYLQWFFRFWSVDANVLGKFSTKRSNALLRYGSNVSRCSWSFSVSTVHRSWPIAWEFLTVCDLFYDQKFSKMVMKRSVTVMDRSETVTNVGRSETILNG